MYRNGELLFPGTRPAPSGGPRPVTLAQLQAANPGMFPQYHVPVYDPLENQRRANMRQQFAAGVADAGGIRITLDANGTVVEAPAQRLMDDKLDKALAGRVPQDADELDRWLKEAGVGDVAERLRMVLEYGPTLRAAAPPRAITHTLRSLGMRPQTRVTESVFHQRMQANNVPPGQQWALAHEAYTKGHLIPDDDGASSAAQTWRTEPPASITQRHAPTTTRTPPAISGLDAAARQRQAHREMQAAITACRQRRGLNMARGLTLQASVEPCSWLEVG